MKFKVKNASDNKFMVAFNHEGPTFEYAVKDNTITIENGVEVTYSIEGVKVEGYELLTEYTYKWAVDGVDQPAFTIMEDYGPKYLVYKWATKNLTERTVRASNGMTADQRALLKAERLRWLASKGKLSKSVTDDMGGEVVVTKSKSKK
jgi:hypothetical protein